MRSIKHHFENRIERSKNPARFLPRSHCWLWIGYKNSNGYGVVTFEGKKWLAHRLSYWLKHKTLEKDGRKFVCHTCDNPACVNPEHLFLATSQENQLDRIKSRSQITLEEIANIRKSPLPCAALAAQFKLSEKEVELLRPKTYHNRNLAFRRSC